MPWERALSLFRSDVKLVRDALYSLAYIDYVSFIRLIRHDPVLCRPIHAA